MDPTYSISSSEVMVQTAVPSTLTTKLQSGYVYVLSVISCQR